MSNQKPTLPRGTRDFGPDQMVKRNFILNAIKETYQKYGYLPLETPSMENLSVLTGKYGGEGDQLLFRVLNSGDFLSKSNVEDFNEGSKALSPKIAEKGLRYDLTVPFARYVVMNRNDIAFPFRRYQLQPVWRADRPQKGRYREFYQCDADVVGTDSLICEAEIILMIKEVFSKLGILDYSIKMNNRKILAGITEVIGEGDRLSDFSVMIDKMDKIGQEKVLEGLIDKGFSREAVDMLVPILSLQGSNANKVEKLEDLLASSEVGVQGIKEIQEIFSILKKMRGKDIPVDLDVNLARGLSYYTGAIFEVVVNNVNIGSVSGGGRYDDLTGVFGLDGVSGVGFSFGLDRLYDVMEDLKLFPQEVATSTKVLVAYFDEASRDYGFEMVAKLRDASVNSEIYPDLAKPKKQLTYANKKNVPYVIMIGSNEMESGQLSLKDMRNGSQDQLTIEEIINKLAHK